MAVVTIMIIKNVLTQWRQHIGLTRRVDAKCFCRIKKFSLRLPFFLLAPIWTDVSGACIQGRNELEGIVVSSLADCKRRCETETSFKCRSIDYLRTHNKCNLSKDNRQSAGKDYKHPCHDPKYDYSEITQEGWYNF